MRSLQARGIVAASLAVLLQPGPATATAIYSQTSAFTTGRASDVVRPLEVADDFVLSETAIVSGISWRGGYAFGAAGPLPADDFTIRFYADADGAPAQIAFATFQVGNVQRVDTGFDYSFPDGPADMFEYTAAIPDTLLSDRSTLYVSIINDSTGFAGEWFWDRAVDVVEPEDWYRVSAGGSGTWLTSPFSRFQQSHTFTLVPEASVQALIGLGIGARTALRRRRRGRSRRS